MAQMNPFQVTKPRLPTTDPNTMPQAAARSANPFDQTAAMMGGMPSYGSGYYGNDFSTAAQGLFAPTSTVPAVGQPLQPPPATTVNPFVNGAAFSASANGLPYQPAAASAYAPTPTQPMGTTQSPAAQQQASAARQTASTLPPGSPGAGALPTSGQSGAAQPMTNFPTSSLSLDPSAFGLASYFNPDSGDTNAGYNSLLLSGGLNPLTSAVGRFASGQAGRMQDQYLAGLASGAVTPGMSMQQFQQQFINSGGVGTSSDLRAALSRGMQLAQSGAIPGQTPGLSAQDNAALLLYAEIEANPSKLGQMYTNNLGYALPRSSALANYINQATRLNQSRNPGQLTDFVQAYLNGGQ